MRIFERDYVQHKGFTRGTERLRSPAETFADFRRLMPVTGITRLANVTGLDVLGIPVFMAIRPNSRSLSVSQGKGLDVAAARVSALMEAVELWHAERIRAPLIRASYAELVADGTVIDVESLPLASGKSLVHDAPLEWIEGWDLLQNRRVYVPFDVVSMNLVRQPEQYVFSAGSNGLASGNHLLEAIEHGLCEVIERDAFTLWSLGGGSERPETKLDLGSIDDPDLVRLLARYGACGMDVAVWDVTSDVGIPAYACAALERGERPAWRRIGASFGYGCHLSPSVALLRALTEAAQARLTLIAGSRDDNSQAVYQAEQDPAVREGVRAALFATPAGVSFRARGSRASERFDADLSTLLSALAEVGIQQVVVVDLTRPELGVPVVKVVVPGLEGFVHAPDYQPGRRARAASRGGVS